MTPTVRNPHTFPRKLFRIEWQNGGCRWTKIILIILYIPSRVSERVRQFNLNLFYALRSGQFFKIKKMASLCGQYLLLIQLFLVRRLQRGETFFKLMWKCLKTVGEFIDQCINLESPKATTRTSYHLLTLKYTIDKYINKWPKHSYLLTCFVDFKSAVDTIARKALFYQLLNLV